MTASFIAGDWGTSRLRLNLCDENGAILDSKSGPGVGASQDQVADTLFSLVEDWESSLPVILCGMAGSSIGWREMPYLPCPVAPASIARGVLQFAERGRQIAITPGLSCRNVLGTFDVLRGEETQILGALSVEPALAKGRQMVCLPGTHTKWVTMRDGVVERFLTGVSGELFVALQKHSVLIGKIEHVDSAEAFQRGLNQAQTSDADSIHLLFGTRSLQFAGEVEPQHAAAYLSGLIVGRDVAGAAKLVADEFTSARVTIAGSPQLAGRYREALEMLGVDAGVIDGDAASLAGLTAIYREVAQ